ncbi:MAG: thioredoxin family protein [Saprospiraceae bacterium]|nr:thioredoxin family protein [Saprospiraceae bacterium]
MSIQGQLFSYNKQNPVELGKVSWLRNYDDALKASAERNQPILILFQEVPGCGNCTTFGNDIMSHPLIVEVIESCFIPLCIYNNQGGHDKKIIEKYKEPAWNNPVIRIVDKNGMDIVERQPDFRFKSKTIFSIKEALMASGQEIPKYIEILLLETNVLDNKKAEEFYLGMYCFWKGEKEIGVINGVIGTEAGYMFGKEVVKIVYDTDRTNMDDIITKAKKAGCADAIYAPIQKKDTKNHILPVGTYRKDPEDKYYLTTSKYKVIPMTLLQKTIVNRAISIGEDPSVYLSPRQLSVLRDKKSTKNQTGNNIVDVWYK